MVLSNSVRKASHASRTVFASRVNGSYLSCSLMSTARLSDVSMRVHIYVYGKEGDSLLLKELSEFEGVFLYLDIIRRQGIADEESEGIHSFQL